MRWRATKEIAGQRVHEVHPRHQHPVGWAARFVSLLILSELNTDCTQCGVSSLVIQQDGETREFADTKLISPR